MDDGPRSAVRPGPAGPEDPEPGEDPDSDETARDYDQGDYWYEDPQSTSMHQIPRSWSWQPMPQPAETVPAAASPPGAVVGPTAALRGWPGGPGFAVPAGAVPELYDPAYRSSWQLSHKVWQDSGIIWAPAAAEPRLEPGWDGYPPGGFTAPPLSAPTMADSPTLARPEAPARPEARTRSGTRTRFEAPAPFARSRPAEPADPDELYRAWRGSVRQAAQPRTAARRREAAVWKVVRVGVPAAVIVTVGAGAVMMLTGKPNEMLANRADQGNPAGRASGAAAALTDSTFPGYPGQQGAVTVSSIASAGGTRLAVGSAEGHPAIWRRAADGTWTLVSAKSPAVYQRPGVVSLTSVAHGPAGWIAVGDVVSGAPQQPVVVTSVDGVTWRALGNRAGAGTGNRADAGTGNRADAGTGNRAGAGTGNGAGGTAVFAGPHIYVTGVTASRNGYVVVGKHVAGGRVFAAMWWSADLRNWVPGDNGGLDGRLKSSAAYAVAAAATGFIAVGSHGTCHTIWTSPDGRNWGVYDMPVPAGASSAALRLVAVNGTHVVAAGYAVTKAGDIPIAVVSADGGRHWRQIILAAPGGLGAVTALTAAGNGFVAAGQAGPAGAEKAVTWQSRDGSTWSAATTATKAATAAGGGVRQITALTAVGGTVMGTVAGAVTGAAQPGAAPSLVTIPAAP